MKRQQDFKRKPTSTKSFKKARLSPIDRQAQRVGGFAGTKSIAEKKFLDISTSTTLPVTSAWSAINVINSVPNGVSASSRIGRKIHIKSLMIRTAHGLAATSLGGSPIRMLVVYDRQPNALLPGITDILLTDAFNSNNNISNSDRFVTLVDEFLPVVSVQNNFSGGQKTYRKLNLESMFNANIGTGVINDMTSGSILIMFAQNGGITTAGPVVGFTSRIRYTDV